MPTRFQSRTPTAIEWPTLLLIAVCYGLWALSLVAITSFGWWAAPLAAIIVALHSSLTHEAIHGHPTPWPWVNELLLSPPLALLIPYRRFMDLHLRHHQVELTDPDQDPESFYFKADNWRRLPAPVQWIFKINNCLVGRLVLGPGIYAVRFLGSELRAILAGDRHVLGHWLVHLPWLALVVLAVVAIAGLSLPAYILLVAYPSMSLIALRTYAEHQADDAPEHRTAIIEASPFLSLLFLNNNLHVVHHSHPGLAWYRIPARYRAAKTAYLAENGGYTLAGYGELFRRYAFRAKEPVEFPRP